MHTCTQNISYAHRRVAMQFFSGLYEFNLHNLVLPKLANGHFASSIVRIFSGMGCCSGMYTSGICQNRMLVLFLVLWKTKPKFAIIVAIILEVLCKLCWVNKSLYLCIYKHKKCPLINRTIEVFYFRWFPMFFSLSKAGWGIVGIAVYLS